jgi:hypothetical protein
MRKAKRAGKPTKTSTPGQDWDGRLQAVYLRRWADSLDGVPPGANFCALDEYMLPIRPDERREIAKYLRELASDPRALQKMIDAARPPERRGPKSNLKRTWLAVLEFRLRRREGKADLVAAEVARLWMMSRSALFAGCRDHGARTVENRAPGGWRYWAAFELGRFRATHRSMTPSARRAAFIEYLRSLQ